MYPQCMPVLSKNKKNIKNDEILEFFTTTKKHFCILHGHVFVMIQGLWCGLLVNCLISIVYRKCIAAY